MPERIAPELVERIPLDQLAFLRGNPRRGDHTAIRESLEVNGQAEAIVVNRGTHTGVPNEIVGGNNRVAVMRQLGWTEVAVTYVDVDEVRLRKLAVALNRVGDKATYDDRLLADLMASIAAEADLTGTGYDQAAYDDLLRATDVYGDAAAGFLGGLLGGDDSFGEPAQSGPPRPAPSGADSSSGGGEGGGGGTGPANVSNGYVTVSWTLLPEERDIIREATRIAQSKLQTGTAGAALVSICDAYRRENV